MQVNTDSCFLYLHHGLLLLLRSLRGICIVDSSYKIALKSKNTSEQSIFRSDLILFEGQDYTIVCLANNIRGGNWNSTNKRDKHVIRGNSECQVQGRVRSLTQENIFAKHTSINIQKMWPWHINQFTNSCYQFIPQWGCAFSPYLL